jgi:hypothetical protein
MAHFAELDENNIVTRVIVVDNQDTLDENGNEVEEIGIAFCQNLLGGRWLQTSYNGKFRKHYAGVGFKYDTDLDAFIAPKPFASWVFNSQTYNWDAPSPMPQDGKGYYWDEATLSWVEVLPQQ